MNIRRFVAGLQQALPSATSGAVVLAYHLVEAGTDSPVDISLQAFREQLDVLAKFRVLSLAELMLRGQRFDDQPAVTLTFDDAYQNFFEVAWPELAARNLPCTLYVPVAFVAGHGRSPITGARLGPCSWNQLRELSAQGVEIGSHGVDHLNLRRVGATVLERELRLSREMLEQEIGSPVTSFCYPQAKYDSASVALARKHYRSAVVAGGRRFRSNCDPLQIPRFPVRRDETEFEAMLRSRVWLVEALSAQLRQLRA